MKLDQTKQYQSLKCNNCGNIFVWSIEEQELYQKRGIEAPSYCPICRGMMAARERDVARGKYEGSK